MTERVRNATVSAGGGVTRRYSDDVAGFARQGSRQRIAEYDALALASPVKDTDCAAALGALGSGDDGKQIEAARAPTAPIVIKASPAAKTENFGFIDSAKFKAWDATKGDETRSSSRAVYMATRLRRPAGRNACPPDGNYE